ncbi:MAG: hypothetical protein ACRDCC_08335 [Culicoidibacterales bacterium]
MLKDQNTNSDEKTEIKIVPTGFVYEDDDFYFEYHTTDLKGNKVHGYTSVQTEDEIEPTEEEMISQAKTIDFDKLLDARNFSPQFQDMLEELHFSENGMIWISEDSFEIEDEDESINLVDNLQKMISQFTEELDAHNLSDYYLLEDEETLSIFGGLETKFNLETLWQCNTKREIDIMDFCNVDETAVKEANQTQER